MNLAVTGTYSEAYNASLSTYGIGRALESQILLLQQQILKTEQGSLDEEAKQDQIAALESRIENLQRQLQLQQSRQTTGTFETSSVHASIAEAGGSNTTSVSAMTYASSGSSTPQNFGSGNLIAYA